MLEEMRKYGFEYEQDILHWYGVNLKNLSEKFGTPLFVFSLDEFSKRIKKIKDNTEYNHILCFSVKSNNNPHLIAYVKNEGYGVDVVSGGELHLARRIGIDPKKIVFSGIGKTNEEIELAQKEGILLLNIESESEYKSLRNLSKSNNIKFGVSFRVKFEVSLDKLHPYLGVGKKDSKFGLPEDQAFELYKDAFSNNLPIQGIHFHLGSQIKDMKIFDKASELCATFLERLESSGIRIKYVDVGGGLGLDYEELKEPEIKDYLQCFKKLSKDRTIIFELGRYLSAPSGILISKVIRNKKIKNGKSFLVVDSGMTEILRIPLYKVSHKVVPVSKDHEKNQGIFDIVGPICENSDYIAQDVRFPDLQEGDLICILYAGAYTSTMTSNYNGRIFPAEVVIKDGKYVLSRKRQEYNEIFSRDIIIES